jgi:hypothetical protein
MHTEIASVRRSDSRMSGNHRLARTARFLSCHKLLARGAVALLLLMEGLSLQAQTPDSIEQVFQSRIPLGAEALRLGSSGKVLYLLAMAEAEEFAGWHYIRREGRASLTDASGASVQVYPEVIRFRVTASTRKDLLSVVPYPISEPADVNAFLLDLRFQLKLFRGLAQKVILPESTEQIGVPGDVPSEERIYQVTFALPHVPITDRCLLEVYSPGGERLARFPLQLL